jgi:hypothetical protein
MKRPSRKKSVAVSGAWLPLQLDFLRSRACAELSPHAAKLVLDVFALLGPNAVGNGDLSLTPKFMAARGWSGRNTLKAAVQELLDCGLLVQTRQGSRLDCSLFACTLYPMDCDLQKLDVRPGCFTSRDFAGPDGKLAEKPTCEAPARWRRAREKNANGSLVAER